MSGTRHADLERLEQVISSYGANPAKWPDGDRARLLLLLEAHPEYRAFIQMEEAVDHLLDSDLNHFHAPSALMSRISEDAERLHGRGSFWRDLFDFGLFRPAAGLMTAALLGILVGWYSPSLPTDNDLSLDDLAISDSMLNWEIENENG